MPHESAAPPPRLHVTPPTLLAACSSALRLVCPRGLLKQRTRAPEMESARRRLPDGAEGALAGALGHTRLIRAGAGRLVERFNNVFAGDAAYTTNHFAEEATDRYSGGLGEAFIQQRKDHG
ncbi:unnamed protein product [Lampetra planeri]